MSDCEIVTSRLLDAPRELVWQVWTNEEHITRWFGPHGFTTTSYQMDVRPGGTWSYVMHGPDGTDYKNKITFEEVLPPERLVYRHTGDVDTEKVNFLTIVTFQDEAGKTSLTMCQVFDTPAERQRVIDKYGAAEGAKQTLACLAEYLSSLEAR